MKRMDTSLEMKDNSESALSTNKEAITTLGLRHGPDSYGRQQWGIFRNGRKLDGAMPRGAAVIQRMQALSGMIGRKASVGGFLSPPSNPRAQPWTGGGNCQAGTAGDKPEEGEDDVKSSCPLCPGRHTCYNGRDKGSRSREGLEKAAINRIFLTLPSRKEEREILFPFRRDQEIGSSRLKKDLRVSKVGPGGSLNAFFFLLIGVISKRLAMDGPAAPKKRIEEASDSFIHAPLGSGGYSSVGRAPLLQLGRCDYGLDV
ncbi:hypothetical protein POTOM_062039 (chloroplast) [Populus tomentosa]|uniref:Uncharacterized protein n=1 Tax=Populus tomentosa TaxID=118781 RepID=A0A8X7XLN2_POPTO|nr:hypothetical protein POTOM_062039 [Populus tomentosa]